MSSNETQFFLRSSRENFYKHQIDSKSNIEEGLSNECILTLLGKGAMNQKCGYCAFPTRRKEKGKIAKPLN